MTRARDVADTQDNTGGAVAPFVAGKNAIINGAMDIWQRGTSFTTTSGVAYTADRWNSWAVSGGGSVTTTRQTVSDTTNLPSIQYCTKFQRVAGNTSTSLLSFFYTAESADSYRFAGQTVTLSFYAKRGANFSSTSNILVSGVRTGTGTDQRMYDFTGNAEQNQNNTLTTTWQRFTQTATVASNVTEIALQFYYAGVGTAGADDSFSITGVQLELGSQATPFARASGSIGGELALCQRYYWRFTATAGGANYLCLGRTTSQVDVEIQHPVQMRTSPTALEYGGTTDVSDINVAGYNTTSLSFANASVLFASIRANTQASLAQGKTYVFGVQTNAFYGFSAEL
jgi:hypothetical protein